MKKTPNKAIEDLLQKQHGFKGTPSLNEPAASLEHYTKIEHEKYVIHARQFDGFYRYTFKSI